MSNKKIIYSIILFLMLLTCMRIFMPDITDNTSFSSAVYARNGKLLRLTTAEDQIYRLFVPLENMPLLLKKNVLLHEDRFFYWHQGVNYFSLCRALLETYVSKSRRMGASTITMQVARLSYKIDSRNPAGKMRQIMLALLMEMFYSKNEIFEAYLNLAPYGGNIEGVGAASLIYFEKQPEHLLLPEIITLCVIPQNPNVRRPRSESINQELLSARQRLYKNLPGYYKDDPRWKSIVDMPIAASQSSDLPFLAPHFTNRILQEYGSGHSLLTSIDIDLQKMIEEKIRKYVEKKKQLGLDNAVVMLLDYQTMEVMAEAGSADFFDEKIQGQVNGTMGLRSPGSTLKPFIYALAMDQGLIHAQTMIIDAPRSYGTYNPENFDNDFQGPLSAQDALVLSRNVPAITIANQIHNPDLYGFLRQAGLEYLREKEFYGLNLVLGGAEVRMQDLVKLYALLANEGKVKEIISVLQIDKDKVRSQQNIQRPLISNEACLLTLEMMRHQPRPGRYYNQSWARDQIHVYWKTGTSRAFRDAWSIAVFGKYVLAVWAGNFDGQGNPYFVGRDAAGHLLFEIIDGIKAQNREIYPWIHERLLSCEGLREIDVCAVSGKLLNADCKLKKKTWFIPGRSPIDPCRIHRKVYINQKGYRVMQKEEPGIREEIYEFWPSDILQIYQRAGIPRRIPPPFEHEVITRQSSESGAAPEIINPVKNVVYSIRINYQEKETIPLQAITDTDVRYISWFAGDHYIGRAKAGEIFFWKPIHGNHLLRVVDDHGRAAAREIKIELVK